LPPDYAGLIKIRQYDRACWVRNLPSKTDLK
jgi:hypothetical protein